MRFWWHGWFLILQTTIVRKCYHPWEGRLTIAQNIRACQDAGIESHRAQVMATCNIQAASAQFKSKNSCLKFSTIGHFHSDCEANVSYRHHNKRSVVEAYSRLPSTPCLRCKINFLWLKQYPRLFTYRVWLGNRQRDSQPQAHHKEQECLKTNCHNQPQ